MWSKSEHGWNNGAESSLKRVSRTIQLRSYSSMFLCRVLFIIVTGIIIFIVVVGFFIAFIIVVGFFIVFMIGYRCSPLLQILYFLQAQHQHHHRRYHRITQHNLIIRFVTSVFCLGWFQGQPTQTTVGIFVSYWWFEWRRDSLGMDDSSEEEPTQEALVVRTALFGATTIGHSTPFSAYPSDTLKNILHV